MQQITDNNDDSFNGDADEKGNFSRPSHWGSVMMSNKFGICMPSQA